jgi:CBS domain-containing protein
MNQHRIEFAGDCMSAPAITVGPDDPARRVVELLIEHRISGLPVVDADGYPVGVVSEWDFVADPRRHERSRELWLALLSEGQAMNETYLAALDQEFGKVRRFMTAPTLTVDERAPIAEVAETFERLRARRVVVTRDGKVAGVITRADLMRAFAGAPHAPEAPSAEVAARPDVAPLSPAPQLAAPFEGEFSAAALRDRVAVFERQASDRRAHASEIARLERETLVRELLAAKLTAEEWAAMQSDARAAATRGETQCIVMRFPAALCADGGRRVNLPDPDWPSTLQGKPAQFYLRWRDELRPLGFRLGARIATFPDGLPGEIELSLVWGRSN